MSCALKVLVLSLHIYFSQSQLFLTSNLPLWRMVDRSSDSGDRLLLTGLIESGDDHLARRLSRVDERYFLGVVSYSGLCTWIICGFKRIGPFKSNHYIAEIIAYIWAFGVLFSMITLTLSQVVKYRVTSKLESIVGRAQLLNILSTSNNAVDRAPGWAALRYFTENIFHFMGRHFEFVCLDKNALNGRLSWPHVRYLTVNEDKQSNLFFWYFPAQGTEHLYDEDRNFDDSDDRANHKLRIQTTKQDPSSSENQDDRPVVLWLQGGPGSSSLFGLFTENGPFFINDDEISIRKNPFSWHTKYNLLFIDNPVGTGFSFTDADGYCQNITQVARQLYSGLRQFFELFPWLSSNSFYITGESFAGKYIPAIGYEIYQRNNVEEFQINLQGLALGNALSDPYNMLNYGDYAYQTGLIDKHGWRQMKIFEILAKEHINDAYGKIYWDAQLATFIQYSNYSNVYNILEPKALEFDTFVAFMNQPHIRKAIHVGDQQFASSDTVYFSLISDFMTTAMHWTEKLLNEGLRIMYYSGNMDLIVAYPLSEEAYSRMKWNGIDLYRSAYRKVFYVNGTLHGYIKKAKNFYDVLILNAGHMVPTDQPNAALTLLDRFIRNTL